MSAVPATSTNLVPVDPKSETSVIALLERAAGWLSEAVHRGDPSEIAMVKAQVATAAEATKQLSLSKEIQLDAQEMVRRAEYALGKAIRKGQAEGTVATARSGRTSYDRPAPTDFAKDVELYDRPSQGKAGIFSLADARHEDFDAAIEEAKSEGNLSRANVVRKVKSQSLGPASRDQRAGLIADLAAQGWASRQMVERVGVSEGAIRKIARDYDIEIPADRVTSKNRRINSNRVLSGVAESLEVAVFSLQQIDTKDLDRESAQEWIDSLTESVTAIRKAVRTIKESLHE